MSRRRPPGAATLVALSLALSPAALSCGVPTGGPPEPIASAEVPSALAAPSRPPAPMTSVAPQLDQPRIYLVDADGVLVPRGRETTGTTLAARLDDLLAGLAEGPTAGERSEELSTALPPGMRLSVAEIDGDTVTIELAGSGDAPSGEASRRAVGQIVLTATSLEGVTGVLLSRDGAPVEAPLPSGELTSAPLTAADYAALVTTPPS